MTLTLPTVDLLGMQVANVTEDHVLDYMFGELREGRGGWLITANLDFMRRFVKMRDMRELYAQADVIVADGMPLVWASYLQGTLLPERVAGSALIYRFAEYAAREGRSVYLLGGDPGAGEGCARVLEQLAPGLRICGMSAPRVSGAPTAAELVTICEDLERAKPDLLLVGLGSPKQEQLIRALRPRFATTWMVGVGVSFSFVAGTVSRAPVWMRKTGLEWVHRLSQEPKRLGKRYLVEDVPFAFEMFARILQRRVSSK